MSAYDYDKEPHGKPSDPPTRETEQMIEAREATEASAEKRSLPSSRSAGSFFKPSDPWLVIEVPMVIKQKWGYQLVISERATEDGKIRISVPGSDVPLMEIDVPQMAAAVQDEPTG